jgi:hypothetical protein
MRHIFERILGVNILKLTITYKNLSHLCSTLSTYSIPLSIIINSQSNKYAFMNIY